MRASLDLAPVWLAEVARLIPEIQAGMPGRPRRHATRTSAVPNQPAWPQVASTAVHNPERVVPASPLADESRLWEAINQLLQQVSLRRRLILFLDDLQWADASTVSLLGYLVRHSASSGMLFVGTTRPAGTRPQAASTAVHNPEGVVPADAPSRLVLLMQALTREERLVRLVLGPLTPGDTSALAGKLSP